MNHERTRLLRNAVAGVVAISGGLAVLYGFLTFLGAVDPAEALAATLVVVGLALVWLVGFSYRMHTHAVRLVQRSDRERRGY